MFQTWLHESLVGVGMLYLILVIQAVIFLPLAWWCPADKAQPVFRRDMVTDLLFIAFAVILIEPANALFLGMLHAKFHVSTLFHPLSPDGADHRSGWALVCYVIATLGLLDFCQYWVHRALLHGRRLWRFHAIHHSSIHVDWLSNNRSHPINFILLNTVVLDLLGFLGFTVSQSLWANVFLTVNACLLHANLDWTYGPLRHVFASPVFHRWHHTGLKEGGNKNFANIFSIFDHLFGTFHMPAGKVPRNFGVSDRIGEGFWAHLSYPFRRRQGGARNTAAPD